MYLFALLAATASVATSAPPSPEPRVGSSDLGFFTAQNLASKCESAVAPEISYCFAYVAAVTDAARAYEVWLSAREFCLPSGIAQSEVRRAFLTFTKAYPRNLSGQAASVVINALKQTYPCD